MKRFFLASLVIISVCGYSQDSIPNRIPFEGMNIGWINGQNRQQDFPLQWLDKRTGETILSAVAYVDGYFTYNLNRPKDHTHTISATIGRHNEFTPNLVSVGIETSYRNAIGRVWLQYGQQLSIVQDADGSVVRGRNSSMANLKYIREAAAGYHFNKWYGINLEMGIFMSYIGLESYLTQENWNYQRSMVCEFTPFYFSGARIQAFPSKKWKTELWLLNGWQTYNSWSKSIGIGHSNYWRPNESLQVAANFYLGRDSRDHALRFHHDHSVVLRYINRPLAKGLSQAAFSINTHYGFQGRTNSSVAKQYMTGTSFAHRWWFNKNKLALTLRGDYVTNPGLYLAYAPSPVTPNDFTEAIDAGKKLRICQGTVTADLMPTDHFTLRIEYGYRKSSIPYFAGREGTTSPDGWSDTAVGNWRPDLRKSESRVTVAVNFRL